MIKYKVLLYAIFLIGILLNKTYANQYTVKVTLKDTIHLSGYLKYPDGKPAEHVYISSRTYPRIIRTITDSTGYFKLAPALFEDSYYIPERIDFVNKGSRFVNLEVAYSNYNIKNSKEVQRINPKPQKDTTVIIIVNSKNEIFENIEVLAQFPGGLENFIRYLNKNIIYPKKAILANREGEVSVNFIINKKGKVDHIQIKRSIGYGCEEEIIRVLKNSPKWTPRVVYGFARIQQMNLNYSFKLKD